MNGVEPGSGEHMVVVVTSRNTLPFARQCVDSVRWQIGPEAVDLVYLDDASDYDTTDLTALRTEVEFAGGTFLRSQERLYQLGALNRAIGQIRTPQSIVCLLDGDDYLLPHALRTVANAYSDPDVAMTWGNTLVDFRPYQDQRSAYFTRRANLNTAYPSAVWQTRSFRRDGVRCFHLRTFRRWLWDELDVSHLRSVDGATFQTSGDAAFLFPMLELLDDPRHVRFIEDPIYVYRLHQGNVHETNGSRLLRDEEFIRHSLPPRPPLDRAYLRARLNETQNVLPTSIAV